MRTGTRHAFYLVLAVGLAVTLSGCYRSIGGSLEPTPLGEAVAQVQTTPLPLPTFTPMEVEPTEEQVDEFPTLTPFPTLAPPTDTPAPTATQTAVLPDGQGGPFDTETPEPTATQVMVVVVAPSFTPQPTSTLTPLPSSTATPFPTNAPFVPLPTNTPVMIAAVPSNTPVVVAGVPTQIILATATITSVPFRTLPPSATYTPFMPPSPMGVAFVPTFTPAFVEAQPLGERPTDTAVAPLVPVPTTDPALGFVTPVPTAQLVAQGPTLSPFQMTATVMVWEATATSAALQGIIYPTLTPMGMIGQQPVQPGFGTPLPPNVVYITATPFGQAGICSQHSVQVNETLYRIAAQYGVTVQQIAQANNITNPDLILMGATLQIPCPVPSTPTPIAPQQPQQPQTSTGQGGLSSGNIYVVQAGDNIYRLSVRFGVSMQDLMAVNGMSAATSQMIYVGQQLVIPPTATVLATATPFAGQPTPIYIVITATPGGPIG